MRAQLLASLLLFTFCIYAKINVTIVTMLIIIIEISIFLQIPSDCDRCMYTQKHV